ncbi:MAG: GFA family protein [Myxococcales bacterium]|nr:GFA family protein [Myxococcales bacterium]
MSEMKTYRGGCHCGKVGYEVQLELGEVMTCNCSICSKTGTMLAFVPLEQFKLLQGEEALTDYQFNKEVIHHFFCSTCGIRSFARGTGPGGNEMAAVNVRCLDDVDLDSLKIKQVDGKSY